MQQLRARTSFARIGFHAVEVFKLVARGLTTAQIAEHLVISSLTVSVHLRSIYEKLGARTRSDITRYTLKMGLS